MVYTGEIPDPRRNENIKANEANGKNEIRGSNKEIPVIKPNIADVEQNSFVSLQAQAREIKSKLLEDSNKEGNEAKGEGLTDVEKAKIKEAHPDWPNELINMIGSIEEYAIYDKAGLHCEYVNGKPCLVRNDIDMDKKDEDGITNRERMERGLAPISDNGEVIELHHIGQKADSPLAELSITEHRGAENYSILHDSKKPSEIDRESFNQERQEHWKSRAKND